MAVSIYCDGTVTTSNQGYPDCSGLWIEGETFSDQLTQLQLSIDGLTTVLNDLLSFDMEGFESFITYSAIALIIGFSLGMVKRTLGKAG